MRYSDFRGLDPVVALLRNGGTHAYLFLGQEGTGKRSIAAICARAQNCAGAQKPCDECPSCRQYLAGKHPDMHVVAKEKSISVADIRELIDTVNLNPLQGKCHTVLIENADNMTVQAQNALLKTLETPPGHVVFFLTASKTVNLLPTIISRCRVVRFPPLSEEDAVYVLARQHGIAPTRATLLARLSGGSMGSALNLDRDEGYWELRRRVLDALRRLKTPADVGETALLFKNDKDRAKRILQILELCARDRMAIADAGAEPFQADVSETLGSLPMDGATMLRAILMARQRLEANVSWQYVSEMLFFAFLGGKNA